MKDGKTLREYMEAFLEYDNKSTEEFNNHMYSARNDMDAQDMTIRFLTWRVARLGGMVVEISKKLIEMEEHHE